MLISTSSQMLFLKVTKILSEVNMLDDDFRMSGTPYQIRFYGITRNPWGPTDVF